MRRKEEISKQGQTNDKAKQNSTPKAVTFPEKNELPRVGLEPTTHVHVYYISCTQLHVHVHTHNVLAYIIGYDRFNCMCLYK